MSSLDQLKKKAPDAVKPKGKIELFSPQYFAACTLGGIIGTFLIFPLFGALGFGITSFLNTPIASNPTHRS
jgi:hypothetical protein